MARKRRFDLAAGVAAGVLLIVFIVLRASVSQGQISVPSTYDTGLHGYAALYDLLAHENVNTERFGDPLSQLYKRRGTLVIAGDNAFLTIASARMQSRALDTWVRKGSTLAIFGSVPSWLGSPLGLHVPLGLPSVKRITAHLAWGGCGLHARALDVAGEFTQAMPAGCTRDRVTLLRVGNRAVAIAYRRGKGTILFATTPTLFDNEHLAQRANALFAYAILSRGGTVAFEERMYGYATGRSFWQVLPLAMRVAIVLACVAVLLAIAGANLPFAPAQPPPGAQERDSSEYIASLARMLQRGGAQREIVRRLCAHVQLVVGPRAFSDDAASALLERARALQSLSSPRGEDVTAAGRLFARVQKEYEW